ncbi:hypothetical protein ETN89_20650 (plasmid) [Photobacterium damselae subsp. damselae]|uniref:hypothetical protein n=1 Tax=Photobacterium damselae TaxID=38293 RepID=UPI000A2F9649|nr:hypothetical protein [Photobacterium damselae]ARR51873.1 hypothetical protein CAY62_20950 [Photobacterium damselae subsp. damselae]QAY37642.1 hypothetical protein ETN89_20650 [Photobacterium damselae subsp. damselae]
MTHKLETLTGKMDALRAKGFSDEEINALLSHAHSDNHDTLGGLFNNGASAEEWNEQVDNAEKLYLKQNGVAVVFFIACLISLALGDYDIIPMDWGFVGAFLGFSGVWITMAYYAPKNREQFKFFIKKRR